MTKMCFVLIALVGGTALASERPNGQTLPGYDYGEARLATAPFTLEDLATLRATVLLTEEDERWLKKSKAVLAPQAEQVLDTWYGFVGANPHLLYYFHNAQGQPDGDYLARVRGRFIQCVYDTADAQYDQDWLNYQYEIARRHHRVGKNQTDGATGPEHIPMSLLLALVYPVTATLKPFLDNGQYSPSEVDAMHQAWTKSVLLQAILWSHPYVVEGDF